MQQRFNLSCKKPLIAVGKKCQLELFERNVCEALTRFPTEQVGRYCTASFHLSLLSQANRKGTRRDDLV